MRRGHADYNLGIVKYHAKTSELAAAVGNAYEVFGAYRLGNQLGY